MMRAKKLFKKKNWAYYLCLFVTFTVVYFFVALLFDKHELRYSIISGLVGGVVFTALWWILDLAMDNIIIKHTKTFLALLAALSMTTTTMAQNGGFILSLREDLVDFSTMSVSGAEQNPYSTDYRHTFGTELSLGYRFALDDNWEMGLSAGLMLHDYAHTGVFHAWEHPTNTTSDGLFTVTEWQTYDKQTTVNLPFVFNVRYLFVDWSETMLWDVVPLLSTRFGYVVGLTSIKGEYINETTVNNVPNPYGATPGTEREWRTTRFNRQGWFSAIGVGARYGNFDLELEYTFQPKHIITDKRYERINTDGTPASTPGQIHDEHYDSHLDNSDGLTLRLTYNF